MGQTIAEKILSKKIGKAKYKAGDVGFIEPDIAMLYDWPGFDGMVREINLNPDKVIINVDHFFIQRDEEQAKVLRNFRLTAKKYGLKYFYDVGRSGIGYQLLVEKGHIKPGILGFHPDPHVSTFGAFGAYCIGVGGDIMSVFQLGKCWIKLPETLKVEVTGKFQPGVTSRDLFEKMLKDLGPDGGLGKVIEYTGPAISEMSMESRMVLCNSVQYLAAETAIIGSDETTAAYLKNYGLKDVEMLQSDPDANFAKTVKFDVSKLEPQVVTPPDVYYVKSIKETEGIELHQAMIGTCASGRIEDLRLAAKVLKGKKVHPSVRMFISPITPKIYEDAAKEGLLSTFVEAGAVLGPASCGFCYGGFGYLMPGENAITTGTLNIQGRMGSIYSGIYMGNPATVAASAIEGKITDPRKYL
jgi:3-isopropylmalate/(R)-2-methylmalate dehydratase large subunit